MIRIPRLRNLGALASVAACAGFIYLHDPRASAHEYIIMPACRALFDGEDSHKIAITFMKFPFLAPKLPERWLKTLDPDHSLSVTLFKNAKNPRVQPLTLPTPIGLAAGVDKNGDAIDALFGIGFSWVEVGSVTPLPQPGNPKPRLFRLPEDRAIINRYGFNSDGHAAVLARLRIREMKSIQNKGVLAVNLGKNKTGDDVQDFVAGVRAFGNHADALVVNVSSPNTPGLRDLQKEEKLGHLLKTLVAERNSLPGSKIPPLLVKIAPDLSVKEVGLMARAITQSGIDGVIVGNTTVQRPPLRSNVKEAGGLSGPPVKPLELAVLRQLRTIVGPDLTIIGCGGISYGEDAMDYREAGADYLQLYTSFIYRGVGTPASVNEDIHTALKGEKWQK